MSSNSVAAAGLSEGYPPGWWASRSSIANSHPFQFGLAPGAFALPIALVTDSRVLCTVQRAPASRSVLPWSSPSLLSSALAPYEAALPNLPIWDLPCRPQQPLCLPQQLLLVFSAGRRVRAALIANNSNSPSTVWNSVLRTIA